MNQSLEVLDDDSSSGSGWQRSWLIHSFIGFNVNDTRGQNISDCYYPIMKQYVFPKSVLMDTRLKYREVIIQSRKLSRVLRQIKSIIFH